MPGQLSTILEAELHDDGGYIYSLFDTHDSSNFKVDPFTNTSTQFKRIFQLEPNMQQLMLDSSKANFSKKRQNVTDDGPTHWHSQYFPFFPGQLF